MADNLKKFGRKIKLTINTGEKVIEDLKMVFSVERFANETLHTMTIDIFNLATGLSPSIARGSLVQLEAGYENFTGEIFKGYVTTTNIFRNDADIVTRLYCKDSANQTGDDPMVDISSASPRNLLDFIRDITDKIGIKVSSENIEFGNLSGSEVYNKPFSKVMDELSKSFNFRWSLFNGQLYLYDKTTGNVSKRIYEINASTGLIETPLLTEIGVNVKTLMEPKLQLGDRYTVDSKGVTLSQSGLEYNDKLAQGMGDQEAFSFVHTGDTHGDAWYTEIIGKVLTNETTSGATADGG